MLTRPGTVSCWNVTPADIKGIIAQIVHVLHIGAFLMMEDRTRVLLMFAQTTEVRIAVLHA